jgi:uncharacterized protein
MVNKYNEKLGNTPIFGMIHLAGDNPDERVIRALDEISVFEEEGIDGCIIENYHGNRTDIKNVLEKLQDTGTTIKIGVNVLPNNFESAYEFTRKYNLGFIQLDVISGNYVHHDFNGDLINPDYYKRLRRSNPDVFVMGGVHPKYYKPIPGSDLKTDLETGVKRADAIVVTGTATAISTPLSKIQNFRRIIGDYPLIVGSGLNSENAFEQLSIADGGIVGDSLKVDKFKIRDIMDIVREVRRNKEC